MKILFASITDSGILRVRSELISELLKIGHDIVIVTPQGTDYQKLVEMGCKFIPISIQQRGLNPISDFFSYEQYKKILKLEKPCMVFLFTTKPNVYCGMACRKLGIPVIMNITGMGSALGNKGIIQIVLVKLYKLACNGKNIKKILFQNDDSMEFFTMHEIGNPAFYFRIPGSGINLEKFPLQPFPKNETVNFLFVARVMKQKGIDQYLDTAREIKKTHPKTVFHVLGDCDNSYKKILETENEKGTIVYHGRVTNIQDYEKLSQCTIHPSYYPEGMSNVILEAAATGRPVITTDHPGCREGVDDGKTGFIIPIKNSTLLIQAVEKILNMTIEERKKMGLNGRKKMEKEFDRKIVTDAYLNMIAEKLGEK